MTERGLWGLLGLLIVAGGVGGWLAGQPRTIVPRLAAELPAPRAQNAEGRLLRPDPLERAGLVPAGPLHDLGRPGLLATGPDGSVYLVDYRDLRVKRVSPDGSVAAVTGADLALENPTDLVRDREGRLLLLDAKAARLLLLEPDGTLVRTAPLTEPALRIAVSPDGTLFALTPNAEDHLFERFDDPARPPAAAFGRLLEPPHQMTYTADGALAGDPQGGFVYAPRYVGVLARFGGDGSLRFLVATLEAVGPPVLIRENGRLRGDPEEPRASLALQVVGDSIVVVHPLTGKAGPAFLDLYALSDGGYRESWRLDRAWLDFQLSGEHLFALTDRGIEIFRLRDGVLPP